MKKFGWPVMGIKRRIKLLLNVFNPKNNTLNDDRVFLKESYSQCGEDLIVMYVFSLRGIPNPSFIDIGANDPFCLSNTAIFYRKGSRGINVEANPRLIDKFNQFRPEDININIGIGSKVGTCDFYVLNDSTLSTFSKEECDNYERTGKYFVTEVKKIHITTIQEILNKYNNGIFPDFLSLDAEGLDFEILKTIDYSNNFPKVICVEASEYSPIGAGERRSELIDFLVTKGYYEYANTNLNAIMVHRGFWFI